MNLRSEASRLFPVLYAVVVFLLVATVVVFAVAAPIIMGVKAPREKAVFAKDGVVDLKDELNWNGNYVYALEGQWEFYPNQFYNWSDFQYGSSKKPEMVTFPHIWTSGDAPMEAKGYATYRMKIKVPPAIEGISIFSLYQYSAYRIYLNDFMAAQAGQLDPSFEDFAMAFYSSSGTAAGRVMQEGDGEYSVIIHIQNELHASPGLQNVVYVSGMTRISALESALNALNSLMVGWLSILFLYFCMVYVHNRERQEYLDYSIVTCMMLYTVLSFSGGPMSPYHFADGNSIIPGSLILRVDYLFPIIGAFFVGRQNLKRMLPKPVMNGLYVVSAVVAIVYIAAPVNFITRSKPFYGILTLLLWLVPAVFHFVELIREKISAAKHGVTKSQNRADFYIDLTSTAIIIAAATVFLFQINAWHSINIFVLTINLHMILQLVVLLRHYKGLENNIRELNKSLETKVAKRTEALQKMTRKAEEASRYKSDFLARMSHEIRTPLNVITGMSDLIQTDNFDKTQSQYIKNIAEMSHNLLGIINDILDFSKIEAGKMEINPVHYNLRSLFENIASMNRFLAEAKSLSFTAIFDPGTTEVVFGDEQRMRQILTNLVSNAVKYTNTGLVEFRVHEKNIDGKAYIAAQVWDTGVGIQEEDMKRLFGSFERLDRKKNRSISGTGLGLAITKQLLDMMGGSITVESVYGEGSHFSVLIPLVKGDPALVEDDSGDASAVQAASDDLRVLVVDDMPVNLSVAVGYLAQHGIQADTAGSGEEALKKAEALAAEGKRYDLIFMDHMMPGMDGLETTRRFRELERTWNSALRAGDSGTTPVIAFSANTMQGAKELFLSAGMNDLISKPVKPANLNKILKKWLPPEKVTVNNEKAGNSGKQTEQHGELEPENEKTALAALEPLGLTIDKALSYLGTMESVKAYLARLAADFDGYTGALKEAYQKKDWKDFMVRAHGLKGVFATIGKDDLSEQAKNLEFAAKEGRIEECEGKTEGFLAELAAFQGKLLSTSFTQDEKTSNEKDAAQVVDAAAVIAKLEELYTAALGARSRETGKIAKTLDTFSLRGHGDKIWKEKWTELKALLYNFDYAKVAEEIPALIKALGAQTS